MRRCPGKCLGPYLAGVSQQRTTVISPAPQRSSKSWPHSARQVGGSEKMGSQGECGGREDVVGRCAGSGNARAGTALQRAATQGEEKEQAGAWGAGRGGGGGRKGEGVQEGERQGGGRRRKGQRHRKRRKGGGGQGGPGNNGYGQILHIQHY